MDPSLITNMPDELKLQIVSYLPAYHLSKCCLVNKTWNSWASQENVWEATDEKVSNFTKSSFKTYVNSFDEKYTVNSLEQVIEQCKKFSESTPFNQTGLFHCRFPSNPDMWLTVSVHLRIRLINTVFRQLPDNNDTRKTKLFIVRQNLNFEGGNNTKFFFYKTKDYPFPLPSFEYDTQSIVTLQHNTTKLQMQFIRNQLEELMEEGLSRLQLEVPTYHQNTINYCVRAVSGAVALIALHTICR